MQITRHDLSTNELMILSSSLRNAEKSLALGYLMLIGGHLGVHRFYLRRFGSAILQLILFIIAFISYFAFTFLAEFSNDWASGSPIITALVLLALFGGALTIWIIVDLFLLPRMIREWNERIEQDIMNEIVLHRQRQ